MKRPAVIGLSVAGAIAALLAITAVIVVAGRQRGAPARCPPGLVAHGARCCGGGQRLQAGRCVGRPASCAAGMHSARGAHAGCVADNRRIQYAGGQLAVGPSDWEAQGVVDPRVVHVRPFALDSTEVTVERWQECVLAGTCRAAESTEPGRPVTDVSPAEAEAFCRSTDGRLPTGDEWLFAAVGREGRRFPWGSTGLVCRRVAFGLERGPCARGASGPDLAGARPDGASPQGALDLAGNVAEWTQQGGGKWVARGGSYRSQIAADLKSWAAQPTDHAAPDIGFRCAYDVSPGP